jgi:hypothetical protein
MGVAMESPTTDRLGVEDDAYRWRLLEELMLACYYAGERELGLAACEAILAQRGHGDGFREYVARNEVHYLQNLEADRKGAFVVPLALREYGGVEYACLNPSVVEWRGRVVVNVRLVNYRQENGRFYTSCSSDRVIRTRNATLEWDSIRGRSKGARVATVALPEGWDGGGRVQGLEDLRWFVFRDRVWFTATCHHTPGCAGSAQVVLGRMNEELDGVDHLVPLRYAGARRVEKNWLPWVRSAALYLIYSYDPVVILHVDAASGACSEAFVSTPTWNASRCRGSAGPVRVPGTERWVALVHEVAFTGEGRVYTHRWVEFDRRFELVACSRPFTFDHRGIEYAAGLCSNGEDGLLVTYGWEDREARWLDYSWERVLEELRANRQEQHGRLRDPQQSQ